MIQYKFIFYYKIPPMLHFKKWAFCVAEFIT